MKRADIVNGTIVLRFGGSDFNKCLAIAKGLEGSRFVPADRCWTAIDTKVNRDRLLDAGFEFSHIAKELVDSSRQGKAIIRQKPSSKDISEATKGFYPYQVDGVRWLDEHNGIGIIGDEMGLGKSAQALGYLKLHREYRPVLIICPATMKYVWESEIRKWCGGGIEIISGKSIYVLSQAEFYIINYDILGSWGNELIKMQFAAIIGDEIQYVANKSAKRTKAFQKLRNSANGLRAIILLSGTPILNRPAEFFTALNAVSPANFPNRWGFLYRYCNPRHNGYGWTFKGATNIEELHSRINDLMIRRLKDDVLKELPPKRKVIVELECDNLASIREYANENKRIVSSYADWAMKLYKEGAVKMLGEIEKLKQLAYIMKRNSIIDWIRDYIDTEGKLVVFAYHTRAIDDICEAFKDISVRIDGSTPVKDRKDIVCKFQDDPLCKLFVGQIKAAGVGLTLTAASAVAFAEFGWTPADHIQAEDRIHRIGQKADSVLIYYLVARNTVEKDIMELLQEKYQIVKSILDGEGRYSIFDAEGNILPDLMKRIIG